MHNGGERFPDSLLVAHQACAAGHLQSLSLWERVLLQGEGLCFPT